VSENQNYIMRFPKT